MTKAYFATAINCIDGRVQTPVLDWMKKFCGVDYVDLITEPGPDQVLSEGPTEKVQAIREKVMISVMAHSSEVIAVAGHDDCAANPGPKEQHLHQIQKSVEVVSGWWMPARVLGLWVNEQWQVEIVADTRPSG